MSLLVSLGLAPGIAASASASEDEVDWVYVIEDVLIEQVEVKNVVNGELVAQLRTAVQQGLLPAAEKASVAFATTYATPALTRVTEGPPRRDDGSHARSLASARDEVTAASEPVEGETSALAALRDSLTRAADSAAATADAATGGAAEQLADARDRVRLATSMVRNAADEQALTTDDLATIQQKIVTAEALDSGDRGYYRTVDDALELTQLSAARQAQVVANAATIATRAGGASQILAEVSSDSATPATVQDLIATTQDGIAEAQDLLSPVQDLARAATSSLDRARSHLDHARSAGSPDSFASLGDSYRSKVLSAAEIGYATSAEGQEIQEIAEAVAQNAQEAIAQLHIIDLDDTDLDTAAFEALESSLQSISANAIRISIGADATAFEYQRAADILSNVATEETRVQGTVLEASIASFDHMFLAVLDDPETLDQLGSRSESSYDTTSGGIKLAAANGHNSVVTADNAQTQQEGTAWEETEEAPTSEGGTGGTNGDDCRDETRHEDGFTVYVHYGDSGDDSCQGNNANDVFWVRAGNDNVSSYDGADQLHMGAGEDIGHAYDGNDSLWGGAHADQLFASSGTDEIFDSEDESLDADYLSGGPGRDQCDMKDGDTNDGFYGGEGADPEPVYDTICWTGRGCMYDHFESAGGYDVFPPEP